MREIHWEKLGINLNIKVLNDKEIKAINEGSSYSNIRDYKLFVLSRTVYEFVKVIKHIRLYSEHYGADQDELFDELYKIVLGANPNLKTDQIRLAGHAQSGTCQIEQEQEKKFVDIDKKEILNLGNKVKNRVLGQDKPVDKVVLAIQRASAGLRDPEQPIGSFLLTGPTGVGKTYFSKVLAEELIGGKEFLVRIDCSEYQQRHESSKLIGAPHGYIGYEQGGILTNTVGKNPFSVVLFDEIEKAHEKVYNLLLQIMDEGILTSNTGQNISFKDTIVIMTSNLGVGEAEKVTKTVGFGDANILTSDRRMKAMGRALKKTFKPEFLNRLDAVSHFMPLVDEYICKEITKLELEILLGHLKANKNITINYNEDVVNLIYENGFDVEYGARPLKRAIRKHFATPLSHMILTEELEDNCNLISFVDNEEIKFKLGDGNEKNIK